MPLDLPDVTLVLVDSVAHDLARLALQDTLAQISPAEVLIFSDAPDLISNFGRGFVRPCRSLTDVSQVLWYEAPQYVETSHLLILQYDGWVVNAQAWNPDWLSFDYIGAPWPWHPVPHQVGNGGFSLRSTRLMRHLSESGFSPLQPEDWAICYHYHAALREAGFLFPPASVASRFAFERSAPRPTFGFHGAWNFPHVLSPTRLQERLRSASPYVQSTLAWKELYHAIGISP